MSQLAPIGEAADFYADEDGKQLQPVPRPSEHAGDLGADAARKQPQPMAGAETGGFDASVAHNQLLQELRSIDLKLDGLAEEVRFCLARPGLSESRRSVVGHSPSSREHKTYYFQGQCRRETRRLSHCSDAGHIPGREHRGHDFQGGRRTQLSHACVATESMKAWHQAEPELRSLRSSSSAAQGGHRGPANIKIRTGYGSVSVIRTNVSASRWETFLLSRSRIFGSDHRGMSKARKWRAWSPDSTSRAIFDVFSMALLLYDAFITPYRVAWDLVDESAGLRAVIWGMRIFWTADLLLNLVTGYHDDEAKAVLKIPVTARHYLATWFLTDLACVICDWLTAFYEGERWIRWLLLARLVRGARHVRNLQKLSFGAKLMVQSTGLHLVMDIAQLVLVIVWVNHVICCAWFGIGQYDDSDTGVTWLSGRRSARSGPYYDYLTALHWAMTQMTPGSMEVIPQNSLERLYNVCVLLLGLLMGGSLVATITSRMTQYQLRIDASSRKFMMLRHFLRQQGVDAQRAMAIMMHVKTRTHEKQRIKAKDVEYLSLLPHALQDALWHAWCVQHVSMHTFLNLLNRVDSSAMLAICKGAIVGEDVTEGDLVFEEGFLGDRMYFVLTGRLRYLPGDQAPEVCFPESDPRLTLVADQWCSEPTLWCIWACLGSMEAISTTEVLSISATQLASTLTRYPEAAEVLADYCRAYHMHINEPGVLRSDLSYVFDLSEVLSWVEPETRMQLAVPVIQTMESRFWTDHMRLRRLKQEIAEGKCDVGLVGNEVVRNAFVVALKVYRQSVGDDGTARFLAKVGQVAPNDGRVVGCSCLLPGVKRKARETYSRAVERVLAADLSEIAQHVETHLSEGSHQTVSMQVSQTYGIRTRYLRTSFDATLSENARLTCLSVPASRRRPGGQGTWSHRTSWLVGREGAKVTADLEEVAQILAEQDNVVVLRFDEDQGAGKRSFYLWLNGSEFEALSKDSAKPFIEEWLKGLGPELEKLSEPRDAGAEFAETLSF